MKESWEKFLSGLQQAGEAIENSRSDSEAYRAVMRALAANLDILELNPAFPQFVDSNQFNHKWFLDNPDGYYLQTLLDERYEYRLEGNLGDAAYTSFTLYSGSGASFNTKTLATLFDDDLITDYEGNFRLLLAAENPAGEPNFIQLEKDAGLFWVRQLFNDIENQTKGSFTIRRINTEEKPPAFNADDYARGVRRLGKMMPMITQMILMAFKMQTSKSEPNSVRVWEEMQGGAIFTSDDINYQIGSWELEEGNELVIEGKLPQCRHWNIVAYSPVLASLDEAYHTSSLTGDQLTVDANGGYAIHLGSNPSDKKNRLHTEQRPRGLFVIRIVGAVKDEELTLPTTRILERK